MKTAFIKKLTAPLCALAALVMLSGCVGYTVGSNLPPGVETVYVPTFTNKTGEPELETETTRAAIQELQKDGTLRVVGEAEADTILNVTLTKFRMEPVRFERESPTASSEYRMHLTATVSLTRTKDGTVVAKADKVVGKEDFVRAGSLAAAKQNVLPDAADDLAHQIVKSVVEFW